MAPLVEQLGDLLFVCVADTFFHDLIRGGSMPLGPKGVIAVKRAHAPSWLMHHFDQGELTAECTHDAEVVQLLTLVREGHAAVIPPEQTRFMHVHSRLTAPLGLDDPSDDESPPLGLDDSSDDGSPPKKQCA